MILSILIGGWGTPNQTQLPKIRADSSIAHTEWIIAMLLYNPTFILLNITIFFFNSFNIYFMFLLFLYIYYPVFLSQIWNKIPTILLISFILLLSLGSLFPLIGFLPKWIITELIKNSSIIIATSIPIIILLNLFFYICLVYAASLTISLATNIKVFNHQANLKNKTKQQNTSSLLLSYLRYFNPPSLPAISYLN